MATLVPERHDSCWFRHLRGTELLVALGGVDVIFQADPSTKDQMQIVPSGHSLFSPNFTVLHTRQAKETLLIIYHKSRLK